MSKINWLEKLGWNEDYLDDIRNAGYSYIRQGKYEMGLPFFEALVILKPNSVYDLQTLGALYVQLNQGKKAIKYLDRALQLEGDHSPTLLNLSKAFFMTGNIEEGRRLVNILKNDPNPLIAGTAAALLLSYSQ